MAVSLIEKNYQTNFCRFAFDTWENDKDSLPDLKKRGKGNLATILSCSQGSLAIGTVNGDDYILTGDNTWIRYTGSFGSSSGGSSSGSGSGGNTSDSDNGFIEL